MRRHRQRSYSVFRHRRCVVRMPSHSRHARSRDGRAPVEDTRLDAFFNARFFHQQPNHSHQHHDYRGPKSQPPGALIEAEQKSKFLADRGLRAGPRCLIYSRVGSETIAQCRRDSELPFALGTQQKLFSERLAVRGAQALERVIVRQIKFSQAEARLETILDACLQFFPDAQRAQPQGVETNTKLFRDALAQINLRSLVRGVILLDDLPRMRRQLVETLVEAEMSRLLLVNIINDFHQSWHNGPLQV